MLTHRPKTDDDAPGVTLLSGDVTDAVATRLSEADGKNLEIFGTDIIVQCVAPGLIDEIHVHVLPVLLGAGVPLFRSPTMALVLLEPIISTSNGSVTSMRFRVQRDPTASSRSETGSR